MNSVNFLGQDNFPLSSDTMDFLQNMINLSASVAHLGGNTYILSGCTESGLTVSSGYVVINGEILPFAGGTKQNTVIIKEERRDVTASGYSFPQAYKERTAEFGIGSPSYNWADFVRIETNLQLSESIKNLQTQINALQALPAGVVVMWSGSTTSIPAGWALCEGQLVNGVRVPDLRGRFIVGYSTSDTDYNAIGRTGGAKTVTLSLNQIPAHSHGIKFRTEKWGDNANRRPFPERNGTDGYTATTQDAGGGQAHENRPPYYVLAFLIKL